MLFCAKSSLAWKDFSPKPEGWLLDEFYIEAEYQLNGLNLASRMEALAC